MGCGVTDREGAERRARRLLRWYPKAWRLRYGDEFTQLLIADIGERPRSWRRTLDVARRGLAARVARRPAVASLVLVGTVLVCLWIGTYTVPPGNTAWIACGTRCTPRTVVHLEHSLGPQTPHWAIPVAIAVGIGGAALSLLIYRPRPIRR
jgi:hypothetical protein